ncbi:hypothetical protein DRP04_09525 [Archaeoglobales archaeon]|nr:MAG: hypothetical protein DRP04_09525 [Archaeoglobales archaeon]
MDYIEFLKGLEGIVDEILEKEWAPQMTSTSLAYRIYTHAEKRGLRVTLKDSERAVILFAALGKFKLVRSTPANHYSSS